MKKFLPLILLVLFITTAEKNISAQAYVDSVGIGEIASRIQIGTFNHPELPLGFTENGFTLLPFTNTYKFAAGEEGSTETVDVNMTVTFDGAQYNYDEENDTYSFKEDSLFAQWKNWFISFSPYDDTEGANATDLNNISDNEVLYIIFDSIDNNPPNELYPAVQTSLTGLCGWGRYGDHPYDVYLNGEYIAVWYDDPNKKVAISPFYTDETKNEEVDIVVEQGDTLEIWCTVRSRGYWRLVGLPMKLEATVPATELSLSAEGGTPEITEVDGSLRILPDVSPADASDKRIKWTLENNSINAQITTGGMLKAYPRDSGNGTVTVRGTLAENESVTATMDVTISGQYDIMVDSISVYSWAEKDTIDVNGGSLHIYADVFPEIAANKEVVWDVIDNGTGATINENGVLHAMPSEDGNGDVLVKATAADGTGISDSISIHIKNQITTLVDSISITFEGEFPEIDTNQGSLQLTAEVFPAIASDKSVTWSVIDNGTSTAVDSTGLVKGTGLDSGNGLITVIVTANDGSGIADSIDVLIVGQVTGIADVQISDEIQVYPNPIGYNSTLNIEISNSTVSVKSVTIHNITGKKVYSQVFSADGKLRSMQIPFKEKRGMYFVSISTTKGTVTKKIVKL